MGSCATAVSAVAFFGGWRAERPFELAQALQIGKVGLAAGGIAHGVANLAA